jgi:hypothetical protein
VAAVSPVVVGVIADVLGFDVDPSLVEQVVYGVLFGGVVFATPNAPKV